MPDQFPKLVLLGVESPLTLLELTLEFSLGKAEDAVGAIAPLVDVFVDVGKHGGFALPTVPTNRSELNLVSGPHTAGGRLSYLLDAKFVDRRAFQVLRIMVGALETQGWEVGTISVREPRPGALTQVELPLPDELHDEDYYPAFSEQLTFAVDWVNMPFSWSCRCLVELTRPVESADVQAVADRAESWGALLMANGFALPSEFPLDEIVSYPGDVTQFDEFAIEIAVDRFQACGAAWDVLVNLLDHFSRTAVPVAKLMIE